MNHSISLAVTESFWSRHNFHPNMCKCNVLCIFRSFISFRSLYFTEFLFQPPPHIHFDRRTFHRISSSLSLSVSFFWAVAHLLFSILFQKWRAQFVVVLFLVGILGWVGVWVYIVHTIRTPSNFIFHFCLQTLAQTAIYLSFNFVHFSEMPFHFHSAFLFFFCRPTIFTRLPFCHRLHLHLSISPCVCVFACVCMLAAFLSSAMFV